MIMVHTIHMNMTTTCGFMAKRWERALASQLPRVEQSCQGPQLAVGPTATWVQNGGPGQDLLARGPHGSPRAMGASRSGAGARVARPAMLHTGWARAGKRAFRYGFCTGSSNGQNARREPTTKVGRPQRVARVCGGWLGPLAPRQPHGGAHVVQEQGWRRAQAAGAGGAGRPAVLPASQAQHS